MDAKKVLIGTIIWSLGLFLPMLLNITVMRMAIQDETYNPGHGRMLQDLLNMPLIFQIYFIAMAAVGTTLIILGFVLKPPKD